VVRDTRGAAGRGVAYRKILRKNRKGQVQVKLDGGSTSVSLGEFISTEARSRDEPEPDPEEHRSF